LITRRVLLQTLSTGVLFGNPDSGAKEVITKVERVKGVPTFTLNGKPYTLPVFETYSPEAKYFKQFADTGLRVFSFNTNPGGNNIYRWSRPTSPAPGQWDYSELDELARRALAAAPKDGLILPRVYMGAPEWWMKENPDEMEVLSDGSRAISGPVSARVPVPVGPFPSVASEKWRRDMGDGLKHLIDHIRDSDYRDHIFGYFITGLRTEEWYHWWTASTEQLAGYSTHMVAAFRRWLKNRYGDVRNLRAAWRDPGVEFETAAVPSREERYDAGKLTLRDPARRMNVIDFYCFYNDIVPETIDYFAAIAKRATGGKKVVGAFYAYMYEHHGDPEQGHNALAKYLASPNLDFVFVTGSYRNRQLATGGDNLRAPTMSVALHGKLWYHDNDCGSYVYTRRLREEISRPGVTEERRKDRLRWLNSLGSTETPEETIWMYRRNAGFALCMGMFQSYFDLVHGSYDAPDLMAEVVTLNRMFDRSKSYDRSPNSEILVVADESSCSYCSFRSEMLLRTVEHSQWQLIKIGAPADHILVDDLKLINLDRYKLVVFLNTYNLTDSQRALIEKKVKGGHRTLLWTYAPGLFNGTSSSPDLMAKLTGMRIAVSADETYIAPQIEIAEAASPLASAFGKAGLKTIGPEQPLCKLIAVQDDRAVTLGKLPGGSAATLATKDMGSWTSVYAITAVLPAAFYRELARHAGVHIYNDRDDTFYANKSYVTVHANGAGPRTIRFPRSCELRDAVTEKQLAARTRQYSHDFKNGETIILRWS
jgi:hypothetical protein